MIHKVKKNISHKKNKTTITVPPQEQYEIKAIYINLSLLTFDRQHHNSVLLYIHTQIDIHELENIRFVLWEANLIAQQYLLLKNKSQLRAFLRGAVLLLITLYVTSGTLATVYPMFSWEIHVVIYRHPCRLKLLYEIWQRRKFPAGISLFSDLLLIKRTQELSPSKRRLVDSLPTEDCTLNWIRHSHNVFK